MFARFSSHIARITTLTATSGLALAATVAQAQSSTPSFDGVITFRLSASTPQGVRTEQAEYFTRDGQVRVNIGGARGMSVLAVPSEKKAYVLIPSQRRYAELPASATALLDPATAPPADVTVTRTGKSETIAGLTCQHVLVARGASSTDVCLTRDLGRYVNPLDAMSNGSVPAWQKALAAEGFPLKVIAADGSVSFEVTKVERRVVAKDQFSVPLDYTRTELPGRR